jgi:cytochrome c biogenesis protein CcmG, thiol:disulfide interchange protein DsbE
MRPSTLLLALLLALVAACAPEGEEGGGSLEPLQPAGGDEPLPDFVLPYLDTEGTFASDDLAGAPAVVNFWASWCPPCVDEMPDLEEVHRAAEGQVRFVGINREDNLDRARRLAEETGVTYDLVVDEDDDLFRAVRARGMPTTLLVDGDGTIVHRHAGPLDANGLKDLIRLHLDVRLDG